MYFLTGALVVLLAITVIGSTVDYPSVFVTSTIHTGSAFPQSRNIFQQLLINQLVSILPVDIRNGIDVAVALFGMERDEFLLRCLKESQAFQTYSNIDFITAIQKTIKFIEEKLGNEHKEALESLEEQGFEFAKLLLSNQMKEGEMNNFYDLVVKIVRQQIDGETLIDELPKLIDEILLKYI